MSLDTPWQVEQTWGSNQPVLKGILYGLQPHTAIECGCGNFSTPLLRFASQQLVTIEHDRPWANRMMKKYEQTPKHRWIVHPLSGIKNGTDPVVVSPEVLMSIRRFYKNIAEGLPDYDFLMVDTYRCVRILAAEALMKKARVVMLHDVEPKSREYYRWDLIDHLFEDWCHYEHRPNGRINQVHQIPWTAVYTREPLNLGMVQSHILTDSVRLWDEEVGLEKING